MKLTVPEILQLVSDAPDHQQKIAMLRKHNSAVVEQLLQYNYGEWITFTLPEGAPPYKRDEKTPVAMSPSNLSLEARRLYIFLNGFADHIKMTKKEMLFINILEGLHFTEADVLLAVKDKKLESLYPGLSYEMVYEAISDLLPHVSTLADKPVKNVVEHVKTVPVESTVDREAPLVTKKADRSALTQYKIMENGERIRLRKDGQPWPKPGQKPK